MPVVKCPTGSVTHGEKAVSKVAEACSCRLETKEWSAERREVRNAIPTLLLRDGGF